MRFTQATPPPERAPEPRPDPEGADGIPAGRRELGGRLPIATGRSRRHFLFPAGMRKPVVRVAGGERAEERNAPHAFLCA